MSEFDTKVSQPTLADEDKERQETEAVLARLKSAEKEKQQKDVAQDLQIMIRRTELNVKRQDFARSHDVPFANASGAVFAGLRTLLDEQTLRLADLRPSCGSASTRGSSPAMWR